MRDGYAHSANTVKPQGGYKRQMVGDVKMYLLKAFEGTITPLKGLCDMTIKEI